MGDLFPELGLTGDGDKRVFPLLSARGDLFPGLNANAAEALTENLLVIGFKVFTP